MNNLHQSVERWLVQEGYSIIETKTEDNFKIIIKNIDAFSNNLEIFEPKQQDNVLVIGVKIPLKGKQMIRYNQFNQKEKENFDLSIKAVKDLLAKAGKIDPKLSN